MMPAILVATATMPPPEATMNDAITDLQIRLTHQDDALQELTRTVLQQQRQISDLQAQVEQLKTQVRELTPPQFASAAAEPPPPHY
jgi:SlyX protein